MNTIHKTLANHNMVGDFLKAKKLPLRPSKRLNSKIIHVKAYTLPEDLMIREYGLSGAGTQRPVADRLLGDIGILWYLLKILGMLPLGRSSPGEMYFRLLSLPMLYSVLVYILLLCNACLLLQDKLHNFSEPNASFYDLVFTAVQLVFIVGPVIFAPLHWLQAGQLAAHMGQWRDFQTNFYRVTGKYLLFSLKTKVMWIVSLSIAISVAFVISEVFLVAFAMVRLKDMPFYIYANLIFMLHQQLWCVLCQAIVTSARQLMASIRSEVGLTPALVAEYSAVWLRLANLTEGVGDSLGLPLGNFLLCIFTCITMAAYGALYGLVHGIDSILIAFVVFLSFTCAEIHFFCSKADQATSEVGETVMGQLRQLTSNNKETQKELTLFLHIVASDGPTMSLAGFVTVRKKLMATLLSTLTSYLIVLMQFDDSANDLVSKNALDSSKPGGG